MWDTRYKPTADCKNLVTPDSNATAQRRAWGVVNPNEQRMNWEETEVRIRKGQHELESGLTCIDSATARGRKRAEEHLSNLKTDMREIVDSQSQIDPSFKTQRL